MMLVIRKANTGADALVGPKTDEKYFSGVWHQIHLIGISSRRTPKAPELLRANSSQLVASKLLGFFEQVTHCTAGLRVTSQSPTSGANRKRLVTSCRTYHPCELVHAQSR